MAERQATHQPWWVTTYTGLMGVVLGAMIPAMTSFLSQERTYQTAIDSKMIELSIGILRAEPTPDSRPLREWAIHILSDQAHMRFDDAELKALFTSALPFKGDSGRSGEGVPDK
jgi:hypothetical protein